MTKFRFFDHLLVLFCVVSMWSVSTAAEMRPVPQFTAGKLAGSFSSKERGSPFRAEELKKMEEKKANFAKLTREEKSRLIGNLAQLEAEVRGRVISEDFALLYRAPFFRVRVMNQRGTHRDALKRLSQELGFEIRVTAENEVETAKLPDLAYIGMRSPEGSPNKKNVIDVYAANDHDVHLESSATSVSKLLLTLSQVTTLPQFDETRPGADGSTVAMQKWAGNSSPYGQGENRWTFDSKGNLVSLVGVTEAGKEIHRLEFGGYNAEGYPMEIKDVLFLPDQAEEYYSYSWKLTEWTSSGSVSDEELRKIGIKDGWTVWDHRFDPAVSYQVTNGALLSGEPLFALASKKKAEEQAAERLKAEHEKAPSKFPGQSERGARWKQIPLSYYVFALGGISLFALVLLAIKRLLWKKD